MGYAQYLPKDQYLYTVEQLQDRMCMTLGGRASEQIFFGRITTGAHDDLQKVTKTAFAQVVHYGMNAKIGPLSYYNKNAEYEQKPYSEETARMIDEEVRSMVMKAYDRTLKLIEERRAEVEKVAETLLKKESITREDMIQLLGDRPFDEKHPFDKLLSDQKGGSDSVSPST